MLREARSRGTAMTFLILLISVIASAATAPLQESAGDRSPVQTGEEAPVSPEPGHLPGNEETTRERLRKASGKSNGRESKFLEALLRSEEERSEDKSAERHRPAETKDNKSQRRTRKHKAIFVNYPILPQLRFPSVPTYDLDYGNGYDYGIEERTNGESKRYQESNIFYIRLPPTPYMFVPGLGYISQPPTYSTASLRPQISYSRPTRPKPAYQPNDPFIKLPIDFVSNGKPTSVYQWDKKPGKKPNPDSPITNLENLSASFVSNGKPTTIYQWQTNLKPVKRPELDDLVNNLDKGPYAFNGKPTSFFLLKPDGSTAGHQSIRYPDYQEDNSYYRV